MLRTPDLLSVNPPMCLESLRFICPPNPDALILWIWPLNLQQTAIGVTPSFSESGHCTYNRQLSACTLSLVTWTWALSREPHKKQLLQPVLVSKELSSKFLKSYQKPISVRHQLAVLDTCFLQSTAGMGTMPICENPQENNTKPTDTFQFSSVTQLYLTLCYPMDCCTPDFPVHHQLPELAQTHAHWVGDANQPSHPLSSPSPASSLSQHQGLFQWVRSSYHVVKVLKLQLHH